MSLPPARYAVYIYSPSGPDLMTYSDDLAIAEQGAERFRKLGYKAWVADLHALRDATK